MWPMIIMICVGCAIGMAGLILAGIRAGRLVKAAKAAGIESKKDVEELTRRIQRLGPRIEETSQRAQVAADNLQSLSASVEKLNYLKQEFDDATWFLTRIKS